MKSIFPFCFLFIFAFALMGQDFPPELTEVWEPVPPKVSTDAKGIPSDAMVLFDGNDLHMWQHKDGSPATWVVEDGIMTVNPNSGGIMTKEKFGDIQLHVEWRSPLVIVGEGQGRGNSGIYLQNRYEVQVLDSYESVTYSNGQASSIYKQHIPLVNAMKPSAEWQTYDIIFHAPHFNEKGMKTSSGTVTVIHNGVLVQDHVTLYGASAYIGYPTNKAHGDDIIQLQDHGNPVSYRNIWLRKL